MQSTQNMLPSSIRLAPLAPHAPGMPSDPYGSIQSAAPRPSSALGTIGHRRGTPSLRASIVVLLATSRSPVVQNPPIQRTVSALHDILPLSQQISPLLDAMPLSRSPPLPRTTAPPVYSEFCSFSGQSVIQASPSSSTHRYTSNFAAPPASNCPPSFRQHEAPIWRARGISTRPATARCPLPGCGKMLTRFYLSAHMKVHNRERPYGCGICKLHFRWKSNMVRHVRTVHRTEVRDNASKSNCSTGTMGSDIM
jgi:hypothetical protein